MFTSNVVNTTEGTSVCVIQRHGCYVLRNCRIAFTSVLCVYLSLPSSLPPCTLLTKLNGLCIGLFLFSLFLLWSFS